MAKKNISTTFEHAVIDADAMVITEITKDDEKSYDLRAILREWSGIEGVSLSLKHGSVLPDISESGEVD